MAVSNRFTVATPCGYEVHVELVPVNGCRKDVVMNPESGGAHIGTVAHKRTPGGRRYWKVVPMRCQADGAIEVQTQRKAVQWLVVWHLLAVGHAVSWGGGK